MRREYAYFILAIAFVVAFGLFGICAESQDNGRLGRVVDAFDSNVGQDPLQAEKDLYVKPKPDPKQHPLKKRYPELFGTETEAVVLAFSSPTCAPCRRQALVLSGPALRYTIIKVDRYDKEGELTRWGELMDKWGLGAAVPQIVIVENGEVVKKFKGYTPWLKIRPHAEKALRKNDNKKTDDSHSYPIIDGRDDDRKSDPLRRKYRWRF